VALGEELSNSYKHYDSTVARHKESNSIGKYMREMCSVASSYENLEHHRARQQADVRNVWDFVEISTEREVEEAARVSPLVSLRYVQTLLSKHKIEKHQTSFCCNRQFSVRDSTRLLDNGKTTNIFHCCHTSCSVCSKKIYSDKRVELRKAFKYVKRLNPAASFNILTLTISHQKTDSLENRVRLLSDMRRKLMAHKVVKDLELLFYHSTLEIVYGKSGWHPHYHIMLSKNGDLSDSQSEAIGNQWHKIGKRLGVSVSLDKGTHIGSTDCVDAAATYLSKSQEATDVGNKLSMELVSDSKRYRNSESYAIQELIGLAAAGKWDQIAYSAFKVEKLIVEYLQVKNINYFRGCSKWNQIVKLAVDEVIEDENKDSKVKKFIEISPKAFLELSKHDLLLGTERKDKEGNIIEYDGILKEHRRNKDIEDTYGYILYLLEVKKKDLYIGIENDIVNVTVEDESCLKQDLSFSDKRTVLDSLSNKVEAEYFVAA
jgi:hypothetical protein